VASPLPASSSSACQVWYFKHGVPIWQLPGVAVDCFPLRGGRGLGAALDRLVVVPPQEGQRRALQHLLHARQVVGHRPAERALGVGRLAPPLLSPLFPRRP